MATMLVLASGCSNRVPPMYGFDFGKAASAVFSYDLDTGEYIVVLTSVEDACLHMAANTQPMNEGDWVVSVWQTQSQAGGYVAYVAGGDLEEFVDPYATATFKHDPTWWRITRGKPAKGWLHINLDNGEPVKIRFKADYCSQPLLNGLK